MRKSYRVHVGLNGVYNGDSEFMAGESIMFSGPANKVPAGYLIEDGSAVGRVAYATLFAAIGTTYGAGDGATTFNLPDSRGEFWRGLDMGRGVDVGRVMGVVQLDAMQGHWHEQYYQTGVNTQGPAGVLNGLGTSNATLNASSNAIRGPKSDGVNGVPRIAAENRPRNVPKIPLIKY